MNRYLPIIRSLASTPSERISILNTIAKFWIKNSQFQLIVITKFLQYRIFEVDNILTWLFLSTTPSTSTSSNSSKKKEVEGQGEGKEEVIERGWSNIDNFVILKSCLNNLMSKIKNLSKKVELMKKELELEGKGGKEMVLSGSFLSSFSFLLTIMISFILTIYLPYFHSLYNKPNPNRRTHPRSNNRNNRITIHSNSIKFSKIRIKFNFN